MSDSSLALAILRIAMLFASVYLILIMYSISRQRTGFAKPMTALLLATFLLMFAEFTQIFGMLSSEEYAFYHLSIILIFLIVLSYAIDQMNRNVLAYNHLIHRKLRRKSQFLD